jgi:hypothetical protein
MNFKNPDDSTHEAFANCMHRQQTIPCKGKPCLCKAPIYACKIHGICTSLPTITDVAACSECVDYHPSVDLFKENV